MLFKEIIAACSENHAKVIKEFCAQNVEILYIKEGGIYVDSRYHCTLNGYICICCHVMVINHGVVKLEIPGSDSLAFSWVSSHVRDKNYNNTLI
jgi:hypothetical protein